VALVSGLASCGGGTASTDARGDRASDAARSDGSADARDSAPDAEDAARDLPADEGTPVDLAPAADAAGDALDAADAATAESGSGDAAAGDGPNTADVAGDGADASDAAEASSGDAVASDARDAAASDVGDALLDVVPTECDGGAVERAACGTLCGTRTRTCAAGHWSAWSGCGGEGECSPGQVQSQACGVTKGVCKAGTQARTCGATCAWPAWPACGGTYVGPSTEICGDRADNDCNDAVDEGCGCTPVLPGHGTDIPLTNVVKMMPDQAKCTIYALNKLAFVSVIDGVTKSEARRIPITGGAVDADLSPNGKFLVVGHSTAPIITAIDTTTGTPVDITVAGEQRQVEVDDAGNVFYINARASFDGTGYRKVNVVTGSASDAALPNGLGSTAAIELSKDGKFLFIEDGASPALLHRYDVTAGLTLKESGGAFNETSIVPEIQFPSRFLYLSPGEQHAYYGGFQFSPFDLKRGPLGHYGADDVIFAEDAAGTIAVGATRIYDAQLVRPIAPTYPEGGSAAAFLAGDQEIWYAGKNRNVTFTNVHDVTDDTGLGSRNVPVEPLASYVFQHLVTDHTRDRVYGLDTDRHVVVAVDTTSLKPVGAVVVNAGATVLSIDPTGAALYVGHHYSHSFVRIKLDTFTFDAAPTTPIIPNRIAALAGGRLAAVASDQWTYLYLYEGATGAIVTKGPLAYQPALTRPGDGLALFLGESGLSGSNLFRFAIENDTWVQKDVDNLHSGLGSPYPSQVVTASPDGKTVFYANYAFDASDLRVLNYTTPDDIVAVSPDSRLAFSLDTIYLVADGTKLASITPRPRTVAASRDSKALIVAGTSGLSKVDLSGL
jgi:hypothetical protein